jgi:hypothetical protein
MAYKLTDKEKDANKMMKDLIRKPIKFKGNDFKPGKILLYTYRAKFDKNPYDMSPMIMVLRRSSKYTLGWSINWTPPKMREKVLDFIMKKNKKNIDKGKDIEIDYATIKKIVKGLGPVIRLYINKRISPKGVSVPSYQYYKVTNLRAENFMGISSEEAWKMAVKKKKKKGKKK